MENRDNLDFDNKQDNGESSVYGDVPSMTSHHTKVDTSQIKPSGTGCRTCIIFVLIIGAVIGFIYFTQNQAPDKPNNQPAPMETPSGQTHP